MSLIKTFHFVNETPEIRLRIVRQYEAVRNRVSDISGCDKYIQLPDEKGGCIAFAGTAELPDLVLEISPQKYDKKVQLYYTLFIRDNEESWQEWDFESPDLCSEQVAARISSLMNHTVRFLKKQKKHSYIRLTEQILDSAGNWQTVADSLEDSRLIRLFLTKDIDEEKTITFSIT